MSKFKSVVFLIAVFCFSTILATSDMVAAATKMPDFSLKKAVDGELVSSEVFKDKVLLVTFFATWCPPCIEEIPTLKKLHAELGDSGFSVVALSVDQTGASDVARMVDKKDINYPVLMADAEVMQDFGGVYGIPVSFLINKEGNVVKKFTGYVPEQVLQKDIDSVLNK